jgi:hypothetical protein
MTNQKKKRGPPPKGSRSTPQRTSPAFVTPMAAQVVKRLPEGDDWMYELKFDGYRALIIKDEQRVELRSRKNKDLTSMYRGIAAAGQRAGQRGFRKPRLLNRGRPGPLLKLGKFRHRSVPFLAGDRRCHWQSLRKVRYRPLSLLGYGHAVAEERVARTEKLLEEQRALIDGRRAVGQDTTEASAVLLSLHELQAGFIANRDRRREELEQIATE